MRSHKRKAADAAMATHMPIHKPRADAASHLDETVSLNMFPEPVVVASGEKPCSIDTPQFHVKDLSCGENDPNFPLYDPNHKLYHHFWQVSQANLPSHALISMLNFLAETSHLEHAPLLRCPKRCTNSPLYLFC